MRGKSKLELIDIKKKGFLIEPRYYFFGWSKSSKILARRSAVNALIRAQKLLPKGYRFKVWDCFRTREVQLAMTNSFRKRLRTINTSISPKQLKVLVEKYAGKTSPLLKIERLDNHGNGGSFDLTIVNRQNNELYMGTDHDDLTLKAGTDYFENKKKLNMLEREARKNRRLLIKTLTKVGFLNYKEEWWHWSWEK